MKSNNGLRMIIWSILAFISLGLGITGLVLSGDLKSFNLNIDLSKWFSNNDNNSVDIDFNKVADDLNDYLDKIYADVEGYSGVATYANNKISVHIQASEQEYNIDFLISGNIISNEGGKGFDGLANGLLFTEIVRNVEKEYGISEEDIMLTLNYGIKDLTIEKDGVEVKESDDIITYKLDFSRKMTIPQIPKYVTVEDLTDYSEKVEDGSLQINKGYVTLYKEGDETEATVIILEKNNITSISYNSFVSLLTLMFGEVKVNNFKTTYSDFSIGNKTFDGYKIEVNAVINEWEKLLIENEINWKLTKITIDKSLIE